MVRGSGSAGRRGGAGAGRRRGECVRRFVAALDHAVDAERDLISQHVEVGLVPLAEPHRIAILRGDDADQPIADRQRDGEHALRVGQPRQRNLRLERPVAAFGGAADGAAVAQIGFEAGQPQQTPLARDRADQTFTDRHLGADAALAVATARQRRQPVIRLVVKQHRGVREREVFVERFEDARAAATRGRWRG